ncbi:MAG: sugar phosphate isomerase/epimerase [Bacteroidales bacterium]|nr:sugar phosphate isomerase/epimerase [Bacteroidales bacterium]
MKKTLVIVSALLALASCGTAEKAQDKEIGLQLYSLRNEFKADNYAEVHESIFQTLQESGYKTLETASYNDGKFYGVAPEVLRDDAAKFGLKILSAHTSHNPSTEDLAAGNYDEALAWWDKAIEDHKTAGMEYIVTPGMPHVENLAQLKVYCDFLNAVGEKCKAAGLAFGYHNHSHEMRKVEDVRVYDFMLENTDPEKVFFQMDVYWAVMGQVAPVEYFEKYPGRFKLLHIKDHFTIGKSGMVGFDAIFGNFDKSGTEHIIVEIEGVVEGDNILNSCKESADYLNALESFK